MHNDATWEPIWSESRVEIMPESGQIDVRGKLSVEPHGVRDGVMILGYNGSHSEMAFKLREVKLDRRGTVEISDIAAIISLAQADGDESALMLSYFYQMSLRPDDTPDPPNLLTLRPDVAIAGSGSGWHLRIEGEIPIVPGVMRLIMPSDWHSAAPGLRQRIEGGDHATETWTSQEPVEWAFVAGRYDTSSVQTENWTVRVLLNPADTTAPENYAQGCTRILKALEPRFGSYPYKRYSLVELPEEIVVGGESEHGFIAINSRLLRGSDSPISVNIPLVAHEMTHGWWGDTVQNRQPASAMVNEGLAQLGAVLAIEEIEGLEEAVAFMRFSRGYPDYDPSQSAKGYFNLVRSGRDSPLMEIAFDGTGKALAKSKGMWFYQMLRHRVGDVRFFAILRDLVDTHAGRAISMTEIRDVFLDGDCDFDMGRFLAQWLDRTGAPRISSNWRAARADPSAIDLTLIQDGLPYDLEIEVEIVGENASIRHLLSVHDSRSEFYLNSPLNPHELVIDPDHKLLLWSPEYDGSSEQ